LIAFANKIS